LIFLGFLVLAAVIVIPALFLRPRVHDERPAVVKPVTETPLMHGRASYIGGFLMFMNDEDFPVTNCKLGLTLENGDAYVLRWPALKAHSDTGVLSADSFIKLDIATRTATGERLSVDAKPQSWLMFCDPPSGETIGGAGIIK
jgi:hypothetical protein